VNKRYPIKKNPWIFFVMIFSGLTGLLFPFPLYSDVKFPDVKKFVIIIGQNANLTEKFAASELQRYLGKTTRFNAEIKNDDFEPNGLFPISVGRTRLSEGVHGQFDQSPITSGPDSFIIRIGNNSAVLCGGGDRGTLYSVYEFLEQQGCRWFFPGDLGEVVPENGKLILNKGEREFAPDFVQRELGVAPVGDIRAEDIIDWSAKNRLNRNFNLRNEVIFKSLPPEKRKMNDERGGQIKFQWVAHNLSWMLPPDKYFKSHPEYYALYKGERIPCGSPGKPGYGGGNICTTNPEVTKICADFAIDWFSKNPGGEVVPLWPGDGAIKWCECPECSKLGGINFMPGSRGSMTIRMVVFANAVAKIVAEKYPDRYILCPAYANYVEPVDIPLEKNILLQYCLHGCLVHGPGICAENKKEKEMVEKWSALARGRMGVWEYFLLGDHYSDEQDNPAMLPVVFRARDTLRFLKKSGVNWYFTQASPKYWKHNILPFYVTARMTWNADLDFDSLMNDYCGKMYGEAAKPVKEYYMLIENTVLKDGWHPEVYSDVAVPSPKIFTRELLAKCEKCLLDAEAIPLSEIQKKRLLLVRETFNHIKTNVGMQGTLGIDPEAGWKIERGNDYYLINPDGREISPEELKKIIWHATDTGNYNKQFEKLLFRANKRKIQIQFLENDLLKVGVIPEIGGRIIRIISKKSGRNYLKEPMDANSLKTIGESYFNYGGYEEYIGSSFGGPGWEEPFKFKKTENEKTVSLEMEAEIGDFSLKRTVSLQKGSSNEVRVESLLTNISKEDKTTKLRIHPAVSLGKNSSDYLIWRVLPGGQIVKTTAGKINDTMLSDCGVVTVIGNERENIGIANVLAPNKPVEVSSYFCVTSDDSLNLELIGKQKTLKPGESLTVMHSYLILDDLKNQIDSILKMKIGD
jgi:hypothetical protein